MADAIIQGGIRALVILPAETGMARDVFVNSFAFYVVGGLAVTEAMHDDVQARLVDFYNVNTAGHSPLASFIGTQVDRGALKCMVKTYDMAEQLPRTPHEHPFTLGPITAGSEPFPAEVACCLSFKSNTRKGPRGRGRVFIGPLNDNTATESPAGEVRPTGAFMASVLDAGTKLRTTSGVSPSIDWSIYSTLSDPHMVQVDSCWVDNEYDTIRKRGLRGTTRLTA